MKAVFVSPHYDDAIGSCGASISYLISIGIPVTVATVFCRGPHPQQKVSPFSKKLHDMWGTTDCDVAQIRKDENQSACDILGCFAIDLEYQDSLYRASTEHEGLYNDFAGIFGNIHTLEKSLYTHVTDALLEARGDIYFFPMGFGAHVDHQICRDAGEYLQQTTTNNVYFYRDFHYTRHKLPIESYAGKAAEYLAFEENHFNNKILSFRQYASQIPMLIEDNATLPQYFEEHHQRIDRKYCEIYYKSQQNPSLQSLIPGIYRV